MVSSGEERRKFKRYKGNFELLLTLNDKVLKLQTTDYSLKGIGFIFDNTFSIPSVSDVHFSIQEMDIQDEGKIVWTGKIASYQGGGIERKSIYGLLKHYPLSDILLDLHQGGKSGIFELRKGPIIKRIFMKDGEIVFTTSNREEDRLIEVLLRAGRITNDQYYQILDLSQKKQKSHGTCLVELGYLKPEDLPLTVREQVEGIILGLFRWEDGKFVFIEIPPPSDKVIRLKLSVVKLIYRGIKSIEKVNVIENAMPPKDTILYYSATPIDLYHDINLDEKDKEILHLIDGKHSIQDILSISPLDNLQTIKTLLAFINTRIINIKEKEPPEDKILEDILKESKEEEDPDFIEKVEDLYSKLASSDYYSILGIEKWATLDTIKKAYYIAAKDFHPDKHLSSPSEELKHKLNAIFTYLTEAYKILSTTKTRIQYDQVLTNKHVEPAKTAKSNAELAQLRFRAGQEAFNNGMYNKAKEFLKQAVYLDDSVQYYYFLLGLTLMKEKKLEEAGRILNQAIKLDPYNADCLAELGHVFLKLGFTLRAKATFEKALKIESKNARASEGLQNLKNLS